MDHRTRCLSCTWAHGAAFMFPESGRDVPFQIENYGYLDAFGRETITWVRTFHAKRPRRFDAYMIYSEQRQCIVDYLGTHQHLAVDIDLSVASNGGLCLRSGAQRFYEGRVGFSFPMLFRALPTLANGTTRQNTVFESKLWLETGPGDRCSAIRDISRLSGVLSSGGVPQTLLPRRTEERE